MTLADGVKKKHSTVKEKVTEKAKAKAKEKESPLTTVTSQRTHTRRASTATAEAGDTRRSMTLAPDDDDETIWRSESATDAAPTARYT